MPVSVFLEKKNNVQIVTLAIVHVIPLEMFCHSLRCVRCHHLAHHTTIFRLSGWVGFKHVFVLNTIIVDLWRRYSGARPQDDPSRFNIYPIAGSDELACTQECKE